MRSVRRLYFYLVAFISLETIVWGVIYLARTLFEILPGGGAINQVAGGLALVLVGVPIFLLHWSVAQRDARQDEEERSSLIRALFLYGVGLAMLIPVVQNVLAILSRLLFTLFGASPSQALIGSGQNLADNLTAILVLGISWFYFERVLRADWQLNQPESSLPDVRRLARYVWMIYTLGLTVIGCQYIFHFIFFVPEGITNPSSIWLANGIALVLVGTPLWAWSCLTIQRSLDDPSEAQSTLRLAVLFILALGAAVTCLASAANVLAFTLRWIMGEWTTLPVFLSEHSTSLTLLIIFGVIWAYYARQRQSAVDGQPDPQRRAGLERLYHYTFALGGNIAVFFGVWQLLRVIYELYFGPPGFSAVMRTTLSWALAALAVGLPVYLRSWPPLQRQALLLNDEGDHARRSVVRKIYLYLILFAAVVGAMAAAGYLFYQIISALLGKQEKDLWLLIMQNVVALLQVLVWLGYHLNVLIQDGRLAQKTLTERHVRYPLLILQNGEHPYFDELQTRLKTHLPDLPVNLLRLDQSSPTPELATAKAVILPGETAFRPPEALRLWLEEYTGQRIFAPLSDSDWIWLGTPARSPREMAKETVRAVRALAEGQPVHASLPTNAWVITGYVLAVLFGLEVSFVIFGIVMSLITGG